MNEIENNLQNKPTALSKGYDSFTPSPGEYESWKCRVCGSRAAVRRNVYGPTGYAEAMAKKGHLHDSFSCPNSDKDWHKQSMNLTREKESTSSPRIAALISKDLQEILANHQSEISE